jgi:hypothetical protein
MLQISGDQNRHVKGTCTECGWEFTSPVKADVELFHATHSCGKERYPRPGEEPKDAEHGS